MDEGGKRATAELRLAGLISALSQVADLGMGRPPEDAIRSCLLATDLARRMELGESGVCDIYYATLLQHVGCTAYAHETAALFGGDDIAVRDGGARIDFANPRETLPFLMFEIGKNAPPAGRARAVISAIVKGGEFGERLARSNCEVAVHMARRLGLGDAVRRALNEIHERWDGKGGPQKLAGDDVALPARFAQVASQAVLFDRLGGPELAVEVISRGTSPRGKRQRRADRTRPRRTERMALVDTARGATLLGENGGSRPASERRDGRGRRTMPG